MAHKIEWIEEPWILRVTYWDRMTVDDIETAMQFCLPAVEKHPANFLCDFRGVKSQELEIFKSKAMITLFRHQNARSFALIGLTPIMHTAARTLMGRTSFKSFKEEQAALDFLYQKAAQQKAEASAQADLIEKRVAS